MLPNSAAIFLPTRALTSLCAGLSPPHRHLLTLLGLRHPTLASPYPWCLLHSAWALTAPCSWTPSLPSSDSDTHVGPPSCVVNLLFDLSSGTLLWGTGVLPVRGRCLLDSVPLHGFRTELSCRRRGLQGVGRARVSSILNSKM